MIKYAEALNKYKTLNKMAEKNGVVFFGADWLSGIPLAELARDNGIEAAVYNRSLKGLVLDDAEKVLEACVYGLNPDKVFVNIGENDVKSSSFNINEFAEKYEWLLYAIHSRCNCKIYILSVVSDKQNSVNESLKKIAQKYTCEYVEVQPFHASVEKFFLTVRLFLRSHPITFCEAFRI